LHRFDTAHECDGRTDGQMDGRPDNGKDARSILLSRIKTTAATNNSISRHLKTTTQDNTAVKPQKLTLALKLTAAPFSISRVATFTLP